MSRILQICLACAIVGVQMLFVEGDCNKRLNATQGVLTTNGFPNSLTYTVCIFHIDVGSGRIEVTFENVSLPDNAFVGLDIYSPAGAAKFLNVAQLCPESLVLYSKSHSTAIFISKPTNVSDSYKGVKLHYRRVPEGTCKFKYTSFIGTEQEIQSPGYPKNYEANSTCEYIVAACSKDNVIQISFRDLSFGPSDVLAVYNAGDNSVLLGPLTGPLEGIETGPPSSSSVKIVVNASASSSAVRKYAFVFRELLKGKCVKDYYDGNLGVEQRVSSAGRPCLHAVRSYKETWLRLWFESIRISPGNFVFLALKDSKGRIKVNWNLTSNDPGLVRNFDGIEQGNWFEIEQTANVSFDLRFMSYSADKCPFYKVTEEYESGFSSPGYPANLPRNSRCEVYFKAMDKTKVIHLRFLELFLTPGDDVTVYDPSDGSVMARYDGSENMLVSLTSKGDSVRVVFTSADNETTVWRRFKLAHQALSSDKCLVEYVPLDKSGQFSSVNRSCEFNIYYRTAIEMTFKNIDVPQNSAIAVLQGIKELTSFKSLGNIRSEDSGKTRYFRNVVYSTFTLITVRTDAANAWFHLSFKPFISDRTVLLQGSNGNLLSPYYPESYLRDIEQVYHVIVPNGHVMLNFTEIRLSGERFSNDQVKIYDGNTTSEGARLDYFEGRTPVVVPAWFIGSSNIITVTFYSGKVDVSKRTYRFKALYTMNTQVNYCDALKWPNTHPERNLTLPGRTTKYFCNKDYFNPDYKNYNVGKWVARKCRFDGEWEQGATLTCKRICPKLDEKLKINSTLKWEYSYRSVYYTDKPFDGTYVRFDCRGYEWILNGPETITCTSHGNYSATPPTCKKRPDRETDSSSSNNAWKYGAGIGGALFIVSIVIAVLRVCFGCFTCCNTVSASSTLPMSSLRSEKLS